MDNYNRLLLLVDEEDCVVGFERALRAHLRTHLALHRGFSVFIFNSSNELLVQKRASQKLVFPSRWANSVCSHPFAGSLSFSDPLLDVKIHAVKRIEHELGIRGLSPENLTFITRVLYRASTSTCSRLIPGHPQPQYLLDLVLPESLQCMQGEFGEWEIDYVLSAVSDAPCIPNHDEVEETRYVDRDALESLVAGSDASPWLREISRLIDVFEMQSGNFCPQNGAAPTQESNAAEEGHEVQEGAGEGQDAERPAHKGDQQRHS